MSKKLFIKTFGCQMNEYDSDKMADVLRATEGMQQVATPEEADVILFNTCSVREKAQEKVFSDLGRVRQLMKKNPILLIGVGGCVASQEGAAIVKRAPYVLPAPQSAAGSAFVSIMEGCSKYCTFCVVPYTRGEEVSRPFADVMREVHALAERGVREITLLGQNVNAYRGELEDGDTADLAFLLQAIAALDGVERLRYTTSHPREVTQRLIDVYASTPKLAGHLHLPVQSGSDRILMAMKRGYTALEFKDRVRRLRAVRPDISISSDFIVGFPGETERDFEATMKLIDEVGFDASFSFIYSPRPGTPAAELPDDVPPEVKSERLKRLQERIAQQETVIAEAMIGTTQRVLVEGVSKKNVQELAARTENNRIVNFAGSPGMVGRFVEVKIASVIVHTLRGEAVAH